MKDRRIHSTEAAAYAAVLARRVQMLARALCAAAIGVFVLFVVAFALALVHVAVPNGYWIAFFSAIAGTAAMYGIWWKAARAWTFVAELDAFEYAAAGRYAAESAEAAALLQRWCTEEGCDGVTRALRLSGGDLQQLGAAWHAQQRREQAEGAARKLEQARLEVSAAIKGTPQP